MLDKERQRPGREISHEVIEIGQGRLTESDASVDVVSRIANVIEGERLATQVAPEVQPEIAAADLNHQATPEETQANARAYINMLSRDDRRAA